MTMPAAPANSKSTSKTNPKSMSDSKSTGNAPLLLREDNDGVCVLTLNRPEARNALSEALLAALSETFAAITGDRSVRAVVLAAAGPAFCSGHDLKELTAHRADKDGGHAFFAHVFATCGALMQKIMGLPQPVIAAIQGTATAAGCELVASCDLAIASARARFGTPGVNIGLFCTTPMIPISRNVARKHAMEMLLTGDLISAEDAFRFGLVNRVVAPETERTEAIALAHKIASKSAMTLAIGKRAFYRQIDMGIADAYLYGAGVMVDNMNKQDADEGICAFIEKRAADWKDC